MVCGHNVTRRYKPLTMTERVCRYCSSREFYYDAKLTRYICPTCHLISSNNFSVVAEPPPPNPEMAPAPPPAETTPGLCVDTYVNQFGQEVPVYHVVDPRHENLIPDRKVHVERAMFVRHLQDENVTRNKRHAARELRERGFRRTKRKRFVNGDNVYIWYPEDKKHIFEED